MLQVEQSLYSPWVLRRKSYFRDGERNYSKGRRGMMPGSVQEVRLRKSVVVITERKSRIGRAGVTLTQTCFITKMQNSTTTINEQTYQHAFGPQSLKEPVMQHLQKNLLLPGQA